MRFDLLHGNAPRQTPFTENQRSFFLRALWDFLFRYYISERIMCRYSLGVCADADYASKAANRRSVYGAIVFAGF